MPTFKGHFFTSKNLEKIFSTNKKNESHFLKSIFWEKIFSTNCLPYIAKKPRGPVGEGVQGEYRGGVPGG